ncbi:MAG: NUMOD1 domain-containing DNA-binding protein [Bacillota bacterium]
MAKEGCIYKIENLINSKVYIGQTRVGFNKRIGTHSYELRKNIHNNDHLQRAWNKYGEGNFLFSILEMCDVDDLDNAEVFWISYYKAFLGVYNLESGGNKNKVHSKYSLLKMSKASKEKWSDPSHAKKMREMFSKLHGGKNNVNAKQVICINTGEIFETMTEAGKHFSISGKGIGKVCAGDRLTIGGLQFAFYEKGKEYKLKEIIPRTRGNHHASKEIICINNGMIFDSVASASEYFGINYSNIHQVVLGKNNSTLGVDGNRYQFSYYEKGKTYELKKFNEKMIKTPKKVKCINTGAIFNSTREAAEKMNVNQSKISLCCNGKRGYTGKLPDGTPIKWSFV